MRVAFCILGECASKANSRVITGRVRGGSIKSAKALAFERACALQIPMAARVMYPGPVRVIITIHYRTERNDLDESLVLDALQARYSKGGQRHGTCTRLGVILNDRQVRERHVYHGIDRENPRASVIVESLS